MEGLHTRADKTLNVKDMHAFAILNGLKYMRFEIHQSMYISILNLPLSLRLYPI